ncbi:MAG: site-specific integrase [Thermoleophilia bacterium]
MQELKGRPGHNAGKRFPAEALTPDEVHRLVQGTRGGWNGDRTRALIAVLYRAGLRLSEALALRPADIDLPNGSIRVLKGKGRKARTVGIDPGGLLYLERWLTTRRTVDLPKSAQLFCSRDGAPWTPQAARATIARTAKATGLQKRVHPHGLRHSHAALLSLSNVPVALIQRQLGHSSLATTSRYLDHLAPTQVIAAVHAVNFNASPTSSEEATPTAA